MRTSRRSRNGSRDGFTLIEVLIALVLVGGVIAGTLAALRASVVGSEMHRDHSRAHAWLQSAADRLYAAPKTGCNAAAADKGESTVRATYDGIVDLAPKPDEWASWQIRIVAPVQFWNSGNIDGDPDIEFFFGSDCDASLTLQLVELEVRAPSGQIIESVEIVK